MIRPALACLLSALGALASVDAAAQTPLRANLIESDLGASRPPSREQPSVPPQRAVVPARPGTPERALSPNPLWDIPVDSLAATRERPLFTSSRRAPDAFVPPPMVEAPPPPPPEPPSTMPPSLTLLGTVVDASQSIAIFSNQTSNAVVRRHIGEAEDGWILRSVNGRSAKLAKSDQEFTLALPTRNSDAASEGMPGGLPGAPRPGMPPGAVSPNGGLPPNMPPQLRFPRR
ncbi:hypothetical protein [Methylocapsa acidiphila]|uniref:hypothetical protein n=1 Tax=Methylocapsa acidiphila TaxID=133552 RepID=UPI000687C69D|nr:hypothetical protein [Methylocapsa acidiphila]